MHSDKKIRTGGWFAFIISMLLTVNLAVILDIPYIRQIIGFLFLTLLPGLLILQILKLNKLGLTEKFILSVGLSISFLMFFGLFINMLYPFFGIFKPLSILPLMTTINIAMVILCVLSYKTNKEFINLSISRNLEVITTISQNSAFCFLLLNPRVCKLLFSLYLRQ